MAMLGNFAVPPGLRRQSLVAVECQEQAVRNEASGGLDRDAASQVGRIPNHDDPAVSGAATVDTLADFLPRRKPFARRRYLIPRCAWHFRKDRELHCS